MVFCIRIIAMKTTEKDIAEFLEEKARIGEPIFYLDVVNRFPDVGPLTPHWPSHPLSAIFGHLDDDDQARQRPYRTALVVSKERGKPGDGFFNAMADLRDITILKSEEDKVWLKEFNRLVGYYQKH
jgi:hypothetical protein